MATTITDSIITDLHALAARERQILGGFGFNPAALEGASDALLDRIWREGISWWEPWSEDIDPAATPVPDRRGLVAKLNHGSGELEFQEPGVVVLRVAGVELVQIEHHGSWNIRTVPHHRITPAAARAVFEALQVLGGTGWMADNHVGAYFRDGWVVEVPPAKDVPRGRVYAAILYAAGV